MSARMSAHLAGAVRAQLDALIASLDEYDEPTADQPDVPVLQLLARLHEAAGAARQIELRPESVVLPVPLPRGVRLGKRRTG